MKRREVLIGAAASAAVLALPTPAEAASPTPRVYRQGRWRWVDQLDQDHHSNNPLPGPGDAALVHITTPTGVAVFSTSANGNTYRHDGRSWDRLGPGVWVYGPGLAGPEGTRFASIVSIIQHGGLYHGFVHQETWTDIATIGYTTSADGWHWSPATTIVRGDEPMPDGFRGAASPRVVEHDGEWVMVYDNRHGNGRWGRTHSASAPAGSTDFVKRGVLIEPPSGTLYTETSVPVWSTNWTRWVMTTQTDGGFYITASHDLQNWSNPRRFQSPPNNGTRWYPTLLDPTQPHSGIVGQSMLLTAHRITPGGRRGTQSRRVAI